MRGARQGEVRALLPGDMEWHGSWNHDEPNGKGSMRYANGDQYEGEAQAGRGASSNPGHDPNPNPNPSPHPNPKP